MSRPARRKVADEAEARALLAQQEASGLSLSAWCKAEGIDGRSLGGWRAWFTPLGLVELGVPAPPVSAAVYRVVLGDARVEVGDDFQEATLARLLAVVRQC